MFEEESKYSKERAKIFLKYLVHAAKKHSKPLQRKTDNKKFIYRYPVRRGEKVDLRVDDLSEDRRTHLEMQIDMYYTKNKYLPIELKLKQLKKKYADLKKTKKHSRTKLEKLKEKIKKCEILLKQVQMMDLEKFKL